MTESIHAVAAAQSQGESEFSSNPNTHTQLSLARQQRVLVTTAEALSFLCAESSTELALPSVPLIATAAIDAVSDLAACYLGDNQRPAEFGVSQVVASNAPSLPEAMIPEIANMFRLILSEAVGHEEGSTTELEVMMAVKGIIKQRGEFLTVSTPSAGSRSLSADHIS